MAMPERCGWPPHDPGHELPPTSRARSMLSINTFLVFEMRNLSSEPPTERSNPSTETEPSRNETSFHGSGCHLYLASLASRKSLTERRAAAVGAACARE